MPEMTRCIPCLATGPAIPPPSIQAGILFVVRMPLRTACFLGVLRRGANAPERVHLTGDGLQVSRVNAVANAAKVVEFESCRNRSDENLISKPMSTYRVLIDPETPIPFARPCSNPQPTWAEIGTIVGDGAVLVDLRPETLFRRVGERIAVASPAMVVHHAPTAGDPRFLASRDRTGRLSLHRILQWFGVMGRTLQRRGPFILPQMREKVQP